MRTEYSAVIAFIAAGLLVQPAPAPAAVIGVVGTAVSIRATANKDSQPSLPASIGGALADAIQPQDGWGKWSGKSCLSDLIKGDVLEKKYDVKYEDKTCKVVFTSPPSSCLDLVGKDQPKEDAEKYGSAKKDGSNLVVSFPQKAEDAKAYMHSILKLLPHKDVEVPKECGGKIEPPKCETHSSTKPGQSWAPVTTTTTTPAQTWQTVAPSTTTTSTTTTTTTPAKTTNTWENVKSSSTTTTTTTPAKTTNTWENVKSSTTTSTTTTTTTPVKTTNTWENVKSSSTTSSTTTTTTPAKTSNTWENVKTTTTTTKPTTTTTTTTTTKPTTTVAETWKAVTHTTTTTTKPTTTTKATTKAPTASGDVQWDNAPVRAMRFMRRNA